jgi:REP element-mobilizing transposase RayT
MEQVFQRYPIYFVTACTDRRQSVLANHDIHLRLKCFGREGENRGAWLGDYVLMPDHLHLFVALDGEQISLSSWMKSLKNSLSVDLRKKGVPSPHWQKGFFDHVLRGRESYSEKWEYVRQNPIRAGLVKEANAWEFTGRVFPLEMSNDRRH